MKFVGFTGPKGSGKDTAFEILQKKGKVRGKLSFAGPLKEICAKVSGLPIQYTTDPLLKEKELKEPIILTSRFLRQVKRELINWLPEVNEANEILYNTDKMSLSGYENQVCKSMRELLQVIGSWIREQAFEDWHVQAAFGEKVLGQLDGNMYAITDVRYENELEYLRTKFGEDFAMFYVERPEAEKQLAVATHSSETTVLRLREMIGEDFVLKNDGSIEDFEKIVLSASLPDTSDKVANKKSKFKYARK
jgi:hypothetical protein